MNDGTRTPLWWILAVIGVFISFALLLLAASGTEVW